MKKSNLLKSCESSKQQSDSPKPLKCPGSRRNIFSFFTKKPASKKSTENKLESINKLFKENNKKKKSSGRNVNKKNLNNLSSKDKSKSYEQNILKTQSVENEVEKSVSNSVEKNGETNSSPDNQKGSKFSVNADNDINYNRKLLSPPDLPLPNISNIIQSSNNSSTSKSISDKEVKRNNNPNDKDLTSIDVDNSNDSWYKKQMIRFLKNIPKCGPKHATKEVAFQWLNAYLNFLSIRILNKNFFSAKGDGQSFHAFSEEVVIRIIHQAAALCEKENMLLKLKIPENQKEIIVMSDVHGSLADIIRAFIVYGLPGDKTYLFLGDYVDRGEYEVEIVILLFALKICFPYSVFLLRGNHEFPDQNRKHNFPKSCKKQFCSSNYWKILNFAFNRLSIAAIIENEIYCSHGGVSQWLKGKHSIEKLVKPMDQNKSLVERLIITDIVWSDTIRAEKHKQKFLFSPTVRGIGYAYSEKGLKEIINLLKVKKIIRGHHPHTDGFYEDYGKICYTVHVRQIEYGSKGSVCKIYRDSKTSKVILEALNYQIDLFFNDSLHVGYAIDDIRKEYLIRQREFLNQDNITNINKQKPSPTSYKYDTICKTQDNEMQKECFYCSNFNLVMKECCSRKRLFVTHLQIYTFMMKYGYIKRLGKSLLLKSHKYEIRFKFCIEEFPAFVDFIYTNYQRHSSLITPKEIKIVQRLNEGINRFKPLVKKSNDIRYNVLSNKMYYENSEELQDGEDILSPTFSLETDKKEEDNEQNEIQFLYKTIDDDE